MQLHKLAEALGARLLLEDGSHWNSRCQGCGRSMHRPDGEPDRICLPCTEREVGETAEDLGRRLSRKMTRRQYEALPRDNDGRPILPTLTWREWRKLVD